MAFKTWSVGDVLTASDVNAYLMQQTVIVCTSGTRPSSPVTGMTIYETDTDLYRRWTGSWVVNIMPKTTYLASDQSTSSTTAADTSLVFAVASGATYRFELDLFHSMTVNGDISLQFTHPGGTLHWGGYISDPAITTSIGSAEFRGRQNQTGSPTTALQAGSNTAGALYNRLSGLYITSASGTVKLQIAQISASGTTTLLTGSSITYSRIA